MLWFSEVPSSHLLISTPRVASLSSHVPTLYRCFQGSRSQINHMPLNPGHRRCFWGLQTHLVPLPPALNQISSLAGRGAARCHPGRSWGVCCVLAYPPFLLPVFFKASWVSAPVTIDAKQITPTSSSLKQPRYSLSQFLWVRNGGRAPWGGSGLGPFTQVQLAMPLPTGVISLLLI